MHLNSAKMGKKIASGTTLCESKAFLLIKPLPYTFCHSFFSKYPTTPLMFDEPSGEVTLCFDRVFTCIFI